jgi:hypothetical protein
VVIRQRLENPDDFKIGNGAALFRSNETLPMPAARVEQPIGFTGKVIKGESPAPPRQHNNSGVTPKLFAALLAVHKQSLSWPDTADVNMQASPLAVFGMFIISGWDSCQTYVDWPAKLLCVAARTTIAGVVLPPQSAKCCHANIKQ